MSKYKVKFCVSTRYVGSEDTEIIDLVKDYGYTEEKAREIFENEEKMQELYEEWLFDNINTGYQILEGEEEENV